MTSTLCKKKSDETSLRSISKDGIIDVYLRKKILIKINSRCCDSHLVNGFLKEEEELDKLNK